MMYVLYDDDEEEGKDRILGLYTKLAEAQLAQYEACGKLISLTQRYKLAKLLPEFQEDTALIGDLKWSDGMALGDE